MVRIRRAVFYPEGQMIRDLEELLLRVPDLDSREFMKEAVRCYQAGAYRASVVMAVAAGMDDLRRKLNRLASSGASTQAVTTAAKSIEEQFQQQKPFEGSLISAAASGVGFITPSEQKKLTLLLTTRHLNAHPSGHPSSSEEARDAIASMIDIVLSRPGLMGAVAAKDLVSRITKPTFYPTLKRPDDAFPVVKEEVRLIAPSTFATLAGLVVDRLVESLRAGGRLHPTWLVASSGSVGEADALIVFLGGMVSLEGRAKEAVAAQIPRLVHEPEAGSDVCWLLAVKPDLVRALEPLERDRTMSLVRSRVDADTNAARVHDEWSRLGW
jgi:hypothetical protein